MNRRLSYWPNLIHAAFFLNPEKRRPIKNNIESDLVKDGVALAPELMRQALGWYQSHFGYQLALQAGIKRLDLKGKEGAPVTEMEQRKAQKYVHDQRLEKRQREQEERERRTANLIVEKLPMPASNLVIGKPIEIAKETTKETTMPVKPKNEGVKPDNDPLQPIQILLSAVRGALAQPEPLRRPFVVAGLRVLIGEIEKTIAAMEDNQAS